MSQENERRARELVTEWMESDGKGLALSILIRKALDEAEARGRPQWRPASERPTGDDGPRIVRVADMSRGQYTTTMWWSRQVCEIYPDGFNGGPVTHWMPLPEPPTPTTEKD